MNFSLAFMSFHCISLTFPYSSLILNLDSYPSFFNLKNHTHLLFHKALKLKKSPLKEHRTGTQNTWVLGLVLPSTCSMSLGESF